MGGNYKLITKVKGCSNRNKEKVERLTETTRQWRPATGRKKICKNLRIF